MNRKIISVLNKRGDVYVDTAIKIIISVVIFALMLYLMYSILTTTYAPQAQNAVDSVYSNDNVGFELSDVPLP